MGSKSCTTPRWIPAGIPASLYGSLTALILAGLWTILPRGPEQTLVASASDSAGSVMSGETSTTLVVDRKAANKALFDALVYIRKLDPDAAPSGFLKVLEANTRAFPSADRDAVFNESLKKLLDVNELDEATRQALEELIAKFSNPDFRALGFAKLARKTGSAEEADRLKALAWSAIKESRRDTPWYRRMLSVSWPVFAVVLGFLASNALGAFLKVIGEHWGKTWVVEKKLEAASPVVPIASGEKKEGMGKGSAVE